MTIADKIEYIQAADFAELNITFVYITENLNVHTYSLCCPRGIVYKKGVAYLHAAKDFCSLPRQFVIERIQWFVD